MKGLAASQVPQLTSELWVYVEGLEGEGLSLFKKTTQFM